MATCTVIKTQATITSSPSERVEELKNLIESIKLPVNAKVGDAVLYDNTKFSFITVSADKLSAETYPSDRYIPIGVVVIPTSHDVYGTGEGAMISLKYMNYSTPDSGSTSSQTLYWGEYNVDTDLSNLNQCVVVGTESSPTSEATSYASSSYLPSDSFSGPVCPTDPLAYYYGENTNNAAPSPYLSDGSRNPVYYQTESPSSELNCFADFDGVGNTNYLLTLATGQENWQTASSITNSSGEGYVPAACCCWRFHTDGTNQGDWYLPSTGELGYMMVRLKTINDTISSIISIYGSSTATTIGTSNYFWASTEYSATYARSVGTSNGGVGDLNKNYNYGYVRAFCRL